MEQTTTPHKKAPWIVVTGMNGSGTTTLQTNLSKLISGRVKTFHIGYSDFVYPTIDQISQWKDNAAKQHATRLLFALDAQLTNEKIKSWRNQYDTLISARGWPDNFFYGAAEGTSYKETKKLLRLEDLEKPSAIFLLTADVKIVLSRITTSLNNSKRVLLPYESPDFLKKLKQEIGRFYLSVRKKHPALSWFLNIPIVEIDTTKLSIDNVYKVARDFLQEKGVYPSTPPVK